MSDASDMLDPAISAQEGVWGDQTCVWCGKTFPCLFYNIEESNTLVPGGLEDDATAILMIRKSVLEPFFLGSDTEGSDGSGTIPDGSQAVTPPRKGKLIFGPDQRQYRILRVNPMAAAFECFLGAPNK